MKKLIYLFPLIFCISCDNQTPQQKEEDEYGKQFLNNTINRLNETKPIKKDSVQIIYTGKEKSIQVISFNEQTEGLVCRHLFITVKNISNTKQSFEIKAIWYDVDNNILGTDTNIKENQTSEFNPDSQKIIELYLLGDIWKAHKYTIEISKL